MPTKETPKIIERKKVVYEYIRSRGEVPTSYIAKELNLTHSQVFYVLKILEREGKVRKVKRGKIAYWSVSK